jgi:hypothetical protein
MTKAEKLLARMRGNPRDWDIEDLKVLALRFGVDWRQPGTSHVTFSVVGQIPVTVPAHKPVKPVYVKKFLALLDLNCPASRSSHSPLKTAAAT